MAAPSEAILKLSRGTTWTLFNGSRAYPNPKIVPALTLEFGRNRHEIQDMLPILSFEGKTVRPLTTFGITNH
jgi:hypothetical protein